MAPVTLVVVPEELLDKIFAYLDWDRSNSSLSPFRPGIINISLTNRRLREIVTPRLFKHVVLKLHWNDGGLVEPALLHLQKDRPDLARHVQSVYIQARLSTKIEVGAGLKKFVIPENTFDWVGQAGGPDDHVAATERIHRLRIRDVGQELLGNGRLTDMELRHFPRLAQRLRSFTDQLPGEAASDATPVASSTTGPVDELGGSDRAKLDENETYHGLPMKQPVREPIDNWFIRGKKLQIDALAIVMLCIPCSVTSIAFQSLSTGDSTWHFTEAYVAMIALEVFANRLRDVATVNAFSHSGAFDKFLPESICNGPVWVRRAMFENLTTLVISEQLAFKSLLVSEGPMSWSRLASRIVHLELGNSYHDNMGMLGFLNKFDRLQTLRFHNIKLYNGRLTHGIGRIPNQDFWLKMLIRVRRKFPTLELQLFQLANSDITSRRSIDFNLPPEAVEWILQEAVPTGRTITADQEEKLTGDFQTSIDLWTAENSRRRKEVREARKDGRLVDEATVDRWKMIS